jgi:hypothetical protein
VQTHFDDDGVYVVKRRVNQNVSAGRICDDEHGEKSETTKRKARNCHKKDFRTCVNDDAKRGGQSCGNENEPCEGSRNGETSEE